ncbi:MAG: phage tail tube protein [Dechloromonas sp.]|nr:phage tail tube protein [Dechloromonas sp.]
MPKFQNKNAILAKIETTYGTDAVPTGAANAILLVDEPEIVPLDMSTVDRKLIREYFGNSEQLPTGVFARVNLKCEIAGSGTAGTAPAWGPLLRACGFAEIITAATKVEYKPVTSNPEACTIYANKDGLLHKLTGARGNVKLNFAVDDIPRFDFSFIGLFNPVTDVAMPATTLTAWKTPLAVNKANTPTFTLHGNAAPLQSLALDMGNQNDFYSLPNATESILFSGRQPKGQVSMEAVSIAVKDWFTTVKNVTLDTLQLIHGTAAGNKVQIDAPKVQINSPKYGGYKGVLMLNGDLALMPNAGNDELVITAL